MVNWDYRGPAGPEYWAGLSEDYEMCGQGRQQSPIDITGYRTEQAGEILFSYVTDAQTIRYDGRFIHVDFPSGNTFRVDRHSYQLTSAHFHTPSEHHIDGQSFAAELHLVHTDHQNNLAVVGQLFELGPANSLVEQVLDRVPEAKHGTANGPPIAAASFLPPQNTRFRYDGSLTTPPCHEQVKWHVMRHPKTISPEQVKTLLHLSHGPTNRPLQPVGDRGIGLVTVER